MVEVVATLVKEVTTAGFAGTGPYQLAGIPSDQPWARPFVNAVGNGNTCEVVGRGGNGEWERTKVTVTAGSPDTLSRDTVIENHLGTTALVNFTAGVKDVTLHGEKFPGLGPMLRGYIAGLVPANNATDAVNDLDFTAGACLDDGLGDIVEIAAATRAIDAVFAEAGPGFRDSADTLTGAKTFHIFAVAGAGKADTLFASTSLSPTLPTGYSRKRRIASLRWTGSAWESISARETAGGGLEVLKKTAGLDFNTTITSAARLTPALSVPTGIQVEARVHVRGQLVGSGWTVLLTSPDQTDVASSATEMSLTAAAGDPSAGSFKIRTDVAAQIGIRCDPNNVSGVISTHGWIDDRR